MIFFFNLVEDDAKILKETKLNIIYVFYSQMYDKNGFCISKFNEIFKSLSFDNKDLINEFDNFIFNKFKKLLDHLLFLKTFDTINLIFDPLIYVEEEKNFIYSYKLSKNFFVRNKNCEIVGVISNYYLKLSEYLFLKNKKYEIFKNINFKIKNYSNRIDKSETIKTDVFFENEIEMIRKIFYSKNIILLNNISFNDSNDTYFIYNKTKKFLIIRYRDYECIPSNPINFTFGEYYNSKKNYTISCLNIKNYDKRKNLDFNCILSIYPNSIYCNFSYFIDYTKIEKLIIISTRYYEFMFDQFLDISKIKKINIEYHCLDSNKMEKIVKDNFSFIPVKKEQEQEYSFDQMYFKLYSKNIF